jgi:hypothetical protein
MATDYESISGWVHVIIQLYSLGFGLNSDELKVCFLFPNLSWFCSLAQLAFQSIDLYAWSFGLVL